MPPRAALSAALVAGVLLGLPAASHAAAYRVGIFAGTASETDQATLRAAYQPLVGYLARATGDSMTLEVSQRFDDTARALGEARYAIFLGPTHVTADAIDDGYAPVAKWNQPLYGLFIAPGGKPYRTLADLRGTRLGIAARDTVVGPLCVGALNRAGLRADEDLRSVYEGKFQDVMTRQLVDGDLDAICTGPAAWKALKRLAPGKFRVIGESVRVPGFALSIDTRLSAPERRKLARVLVGIGRTPEGRRALAAITGSASGASDTLRTSAREYVAANVLVESSRRMYDVQVPRSLR